MYTVTSRKPDGYAVATGPNGVEEWDTKQCCHCDKIFPYKKGSGNIRGFCMRCMKITCGNPACVECFPMRERLNLYERGLLPEVTSPRSEIKMKQSGRSKGGVILP